MKVLIVDDDPTARDVLESFLEAKGYAVASAADGPEALKRVAADPPDVVLLDVMMPGMDGWEVLEALRARSRVPVLMVTAKDATDDVVRGLSGGVDDYIVKPFKLREVEARIQAVLRRSAPLQAQGALAVGPLAIDDARKAVSYRGERVELSPKEYDLLRLLASRPGAVFSDEDIIHKVWPEGSLASSTDVKRYIHLLRQKLEPDPQRPTLVHTVRGFGYKLEVEDDGG